MRIWITSNGRQRFIPHRTVARGDAGVLYHPQNLSFQNLGDRKRQTITISTPRFENITTALPHINCENL